MSVRKVLLLEESEQVNSVGGKAAALGELMRAGFNIPNGFVVTTMSGQKMTQEIEEAILSNFDQLGARKVAVRSSAVAEDGKHDAWAGQMDTFLHVGRSEVIDSVQKCWQSAESKRAKAYAAQKHIKSGRVAVLVQEMIDADISGVAFSVHPVIKNQQQMVIEAVKGLADTLVSGEVTPDSYIIEKQSREVNQMFLSGPMKILSSAKVAELAQLCIKVESYFGFPVDIEWCFDNDLLYLLQSRPITTL